MTERLKFTYNNNTVRFESTAKQNKTKQKITFNPNISNTYSTTCDIFNHFTSERSHREYALYFIPYGERKAYQNRAENLNLSQNVYYCTMWSGFVGYNVHCPRLYDSKNEWETNDIWHLNSIQMIRRKWTYRERYLQHFSFHFSLNKLFYFLCGKVNGNVSIVTDDIIQN